MLKYPNVETIRVLLFSFLSEKTLLRREMENLKKKKVLLKQNAFY